MSSAKVAIRQTLDEAKSFLAQEFPPLLSEADTKAHFVEPLLRALGWHGLGVVTREYYVRNSQEFIDYALRHGDKLVLAIETKKLQVDLADKHAAQLVQYCAVEGIEWAALTNGRELELFNTFLRGDLTTKRVMRLDLRAYNTDAEFDAVFGQLWQLSYERLTAPTEMRTWMHRRRMDATLRAVLTNPGSPVMRHLKAVLGEAEVPATPQDLARWFRANLADPPLRVVPDSEPGGIGNLGPNPPTGGPVPPPSDGTRVKVLDLVRTGVLPAGTALTLAQGTTVVARATVDASGQIVLDGVAYRSPSDKAFARLLGRQSLNGWTAWRAELPTGEVSLDDLRGQVSGRGRVGISVIAV